MSREIRTITSRAEIRADAVKFQVSGTAIPYNTLSADGVPSTGWREKVQPGAFKRTLQSTNSDVRFLWSHDSSKILGRQKNGTLTLRDTPQGLQYTIQLNPKSPEHQSYFAAVQRGDCDACSFGFIVHANDWDKAAGVRTITDAELLECSFVAWPAYDQGTSAEARKRGAAAIPPAKAAEPKMEVIKKLRESVRAMAKSLRGSFGDQVDFASNPHQCATESAAYAHQAAESACAAFAQARSFWNDYDGDDYDYDDPDFDEDCRAVQAHLELACDKMASAALRHAGIMAKKGKK